MKAKNMNKKILVSIGIIVIGIVLILGLFLFNQKSEEFIVIHNESDLETAIGKDIFIKAELRYSKMPILKFGETWIYCWEQDTKPYRDDIARQILKEQGIKSSSGQGVKVKVWDRLRLHQSEFDEEGWTSDQLMHGKYEIIYYRMEIDNE